MCFVRPQKPPAQVTVPDAPVAPAPVAPTPLNQTRQMAPAKATAGTRKDTSLDTLRRDLAIPPVLSELTSGITNRFML